MIEQPSAFLENLAGSPVAQHQRNQPLPAPHSCRRPRRRPWQRRTRASIVGPGTRATIAGSSSPSVRQHTAQTASIWSGPRKQHIARWSVKRQPSDESPGQRCRRGFVPLLFQRLRRQRVTPVLQQKKGCR